MKLKKKTLIILGILLLTHITYTFTKYIVEEYHSYYANSKNFYFTSNILKEDNPLYQINNWSNIGQFSISFDLSSKKNEYIQTDYDIAYKVSVTCPNDVTCTVDKSTGIIYETNHSDNITVTVNPTRVFNENEKITVELNAESTAPYVKKLSARFEYIVGKTGTTYEIEDEPNKPYMLFKVTTAKNYCTVTEAFQSYKVNDVITSSDYYQLSDANKNKCVSNHVSLSFDPYTILLDTTSEILNNATYTTTNYNGSGLINHLEYDIGPLSTIAVKFYKRYPSNNYAYPIVNSTSIVNVNITE